MNFSTILSITLIIVLSIFTINPLFAQNKVVRDIDPFDQVKISNDLKVTFKKSDKEKITIVAQGIGYDKIVSKISGRSLNLKVKTGVLKKTDVQILVEYVKLRSIDASNQASVNFEEKVFGDELMLKATGGAVINIEAELSALNATVSNGGRIDISGCAELLEANVKIGSKLNAYEFETKKGYVKSNTNSDVVVWVQDRLEASAGSKAEVKYRGKPKEVKTSTSLGGKISGGL